MTQNVRACLVVHPYTARKDVGAGHDRYAYELISRLPTCGVDVEVFDSGELQNIPQALLAEMRAIWRLRRRKEAGKVVYHATAAANGQAPISAGKHPVVTTIHDLIWLIVGGKYDNIAKLALKSRAIRRAAHKSDAVIVPFASTRDYMVSEMHVPADRIRIVHYGVDEVAFRPQQPGEEVPRPSFMPADGRNVLFVGATNVAKGVDTLIRSFPFVMSKVPDARLLIGSKGWDTEQVMRIWAESPVRERIKMVGFIAEEELRAAYVHADVTCFPSRYGFGLPTLESMACGTPTISGRVLDAPEFIGEAGLMTNPDDAEELGHQIVRLLLEPELHAEMSKRGLANAQRYRWQACAEKTAELYRQLI